MPGAEIQRSFVVPCTRDPLHNTLDERPARTLPYRSRVREEIVEKESNTRRAGAGEGAVVRDAGNCAVCRILCNQSAHLVRGIRQPSPHRVEQLSSGASL
ncbi:hypothetical protein GCM10027414_27240 [Humibacter ginsengiterrae]